MDGRDAQRQAEVKAWLGRLRHDLVKQAAWRARDLRELGAAPSGADLAALRKGVLSLRDLDGNEATASAVWRQLREEAATFGGAAEAALDGFGEVVAQAEEAARTARSTVDGAGILMRAVLRLEEAFEELSRALRRIAEGGR